MTEPQRIVNVADITLRDTGNGKAFQGKIGSVGHCSASRGWAARSPSCRPASAPGRSIAIT